MTPRALLFAIAVGVIFALPAHGRTIVATAPIDSVTVYSDRAAVKRTVEAAIPAGAHTLRIDDLPSDLDRDSLRIGGKAQGALRIGAVQLKTDFVEKPVQEQERKLRQELQTMEDERQGLRDQIAAYELQLDFIKSLKPETGKRQRDDGPVAKIDPTAWEKAWTTIGSGTAQTYAAMRRVQIKERALADRIQQRTNELNQIRTGRRATISAQISVEADREVKATLELGYQVRGASWRPVYEARLNAETGELAMTLAGEVRQQTGEAWDNVTLTLSTARPARGSGISPLRPWFIGFTPPPRAVYKSAAPASAPAMARAEPSKQPTRRDRAVQLEEEPVQPVEAQIDATSFSAEYRIPGRLGLAADNSPNRFPITTRTFKSELILRAVPKQSPTAYLYARAVHDGTDPLLPGPVSLYRDGMFTGTTNLSLMRPGETLELAFGADDKIAIGYRLTADKREESGLVNKTADHYRRYRLEATNHHKRPITLTVMDQLPVARDERIAVSLIKDSSQPDERDVEHLAGVLAWNLVVAAGKSKTVDFGYVVSHPVDKNVPGF